MIKKSLICILILSFFSLFFLGCSTSTSVWKDGLYKGNGEGLHGMIEVSVEIDKGMISDITITSQNETVGVADLAIEQIPTSMIKNQSTEVDTIVGATVSSQGIIDAVENALSKAK